MKAGGYFEDLDAEPDELPCSGYGDLLARGEAVHVAGQEYCTECVPEVPSREGEEG
jgi:hypothetical protein